MVKSECGPLRTISDNSTDFLKWKGDIIQAFMMLKPHQFGVKLTQSRPPLINFV